MAGKKASKAGLKAGGLRLKASSLKLKAPSPCFKPAFSIDEIGDHG